MPITWETCEEANLGSDLLDFQLELDLWHQMIIMCRLLLPLLILHMLGNMSEIRVCQTMQINCV